MQEKLSDLGLEFSEKNLFDFYYYCFVNDSTLASHIIYHILGICFFKIGQSEQCSSDALSWVEAYLDNVFISISAYLSIYLHFMFSIK